MKYSIWTSGLLTAMPMQQLNWLFIRRILVQLKTVWLNVFVTLQSGSQRIIVLVSEICLPWMRPSLQYMKKVLCRDIRSVAKLLEPKTGGRRCPAAAGIWAAVREFSRRVVGLTLRKNVRSEDR